MIKKFLPYLLAICLAAILIGSVSAQEEQPCGPTDDQVNAIAKQMYCPVCENVPLDVCPTQACAEWRELIRLKLAEGWEEDQIREYFAQQYGDRVLATPPARGFNWLIYIAPPLALVAGVWIIYQALKSWRKPTESPENRPEASTDGADEYADRLEEELKKR